MATFGADSQTETELATGLPKADDSLTRNYKGSAPMDSSITSDTWIPGTNGIDCKLVRGNFFQQIGKAGEEDAQVTTSIQGQESYTISGNRTSTVQGDDTETIYGQSTYTYYDSQSNTFSQTVTADYSSPLQVQQPTNWMVNATSTGLTYDFLFQAGVLAIQLFVFNIQISLQQYQIAVSNFQIAAINFAPDGFKVHWAALESKIEAFGSWLHGFQLKSGASKAQVFGGIITTLIVGPNQIL